MKDYYDYIILLLTLAALLHIAKISSELFFPAKVYRAYLIFAKFLFL